MPEARQLERGDIETIFLYILDVRTKLKQIYDNRLYGSPLDQDTEKLKKEIESTVSTYDFDIDDEEEFVYLLRGKDKFFDDIHGNRLTYSCILDRVFPVKKYPENLILYFYPEMSDKLSTMNETEILQQMSDLEHYVKQNENLQSKLYSDVLHYCKTTIGV